MASCLFSRPILLTRKLNADTEMKSRQTFEIPVTEIPDRIFISPTHKRTEGRAPMRGSEFTSKDAALQGGVGEIDARLNVKFCVLTD